MGWFGSMESVTVVASSQLENLELYTFFSSPNVQRLDNNSVTLCLETPAGCVSGQLSSRISVSDESPLPYLPYMFRKHVANSSIGAHSWGPVVGGHESSEVATCSGVLTVPINTWSSCAWERGSWQPGVAWTASRPARVEWPQRELVKCQSNSPTSCDLEHSPPACH